ncbi:MAG: DinB family protein [Phycisphaerae bacterium]|nr:DinB family protein [Phycisphaerae bacterium]
MHTRELTLSYMRWVRTITEGTLKDWPADKFCFQRTPEDNHALWVMAHLAMTDAWIAGEVGAPGASTPESWQALFGMGSKPGSDAKAYPSAAEVRKSMDANRAAVLKWLETAPEAALAVSLKEKTGGFANDVIDAFLKLAWHEGWHVGQVATLRKALGLPKVMG